MMDLGRRWQVGDRDPVRHWSKGRVVLIGDAAHPPLQSLAQGACMAIEDGLCLGDLIAAAAGDFAAAFRRFETARILRTARVQLRVAGALGFLPGRRHRPGRAQRHRGDVGRGPHAPLPRVALRRV